ncbi:hypothetical protein BC941DRAFT_231405 [Chlamydoabsidia padenii]|nr:hypothetical protein BC941DRAFT_231405 [Chlamydoabsidia padenii]
MVLVCCHIFLLSFIVHPIIGSSVLPLYQVASRGSSLLLLDQVVSLRSSLFLWIKSSPLYQVASFVDKKGLVVSLLIQSGNLLKKQILLNSFKSWYLLVWSSHFPCLYLVIKTNRICMVPVCCHICLLSFRRHRIFGSSCLTMIKCLLLDHVACSWIKLSPLGQASSRGSSCHESLNVTPSHHILLL